MRTLISTVALIAAALLIAFAVFIALHRAFLREERSRNGNEEK